MNFLACSSIVNFEVLSFKSGFSESKPEAEYKLPAVPRAFSFPVGVMGRMCRVFIPRCLSSSSLSIALMKLPRTSPISS